MTNKTQVINVLIKNKRVDALRKKYNVNYNKKFKNHLTLVYPFSNVDKKQLDEHIKSSLHEVKPFSVIFNRFWKFKDNPYIYLISDNGTSKFMKIYRKLNSGSLKNFKNKDMPRYLPHISLAKFKDNKTANKTFSKIKNQRFSIPVKINSIQLLILNKDDSIKYIKNHKLT